MPCYRFHQLVISSALALPELVEIDGGNHPTCLVRFEACSHDELHVRPDDVDDSSDPTTVTNDEGTLVSFRSGVDFCVAATADQVVVRHVVDADAATVRHLLLDHALPRLLAARGQFVAHASAVNYHGKALVFLGESGHGKSSLAASLHRVGHTLLGDDCFVLTELEDGVLGGMSTYRGLRLLPESIDELYTDLPDAAFSSMGADYDKVRIVEQTAASDAHPLPVAAIFVIEEPGHVGAPIAEPLSRRDAMLVLTKNSFRLDPKDASTLAPALDQAATFAAGIPIFQLRYERDFGALDERHKVIFEAADAAT